jgi:hypothetical protein
VEERQRDRERERERTPDKDLDDIWRARASVEDVSGSSLHLSEASQAADAKISDVDILSTGSGLRHPTMIASASETEYSFNE